MSIHCMIDIETLGKTYGSIVLSIGAVAFDPSGHKPRIADFYVNVDEESSRAVGLVSDESTVQWWAKQSSEAREKLKVNAVPVGRALHLFGEFWRNNACQFVWSHGATFDIPLLEAVYRACKYRQPPWAYYNVRDTRTIFDAAAVVPNRNEGVHHYALDDAARQAEAVVQAYKRLIINGKVSPFPPVAQKPLAVETSPDDLDFL